MKCNPWTLALIGAGVVSLPAITQGEEKPSSVMTALSSTTLSGYVDTSAQWNLGTGNNFVPNIPLTGQTKADGFNLNVVRLALEKAADPAEGWGAGYKVDLLFGPDANTYNTLSANQVAKGGDFPADFAIKQAYVDLHAPLGNGIGAKVGVFDTITGYEVFTSPDNPNFTRSYMWGIEPTTHTGILLYYTFNDMLSAQAGVANTFGPSINERANLATGGLKAESYKAYMGSLTFTAPTNWGVIGGSTLTGAIINGFNSADPANDGTFTSADQTSFYIGGTFNTPVTGLKVGAAYDYEGVQQQPLTDQHSAYAESGALYVTYQATEKLTFNTRGEYAWCSHGNTIFTPVTDTGVVGPVIIKEVVSVTETIQYDLWKNVLARVEFRWDHATSVNGPPGLDDPFGGTGTTPPTSLPGKDDSFILLANFVYKF